MSTTTFLHLSDCHLVAPGKLVSGVDPLANLRAVLARAGALDVEPAFVIVSGDLSEDGSRESYELVKRMLGEIGAAGRPVLLALGNHDHRATFRHVILGEAPGNGSERYCHARTIDGLRVIVLDSLVQGEGYGELGEAQLAWLEEQLGTSEPRGTLIVLHHCCRLAAPPDQFPYFVLHDAPALEALVSRYQGQILGVLAGHSHQSNAAPFGGTIHVTAPAILCQLDFFAGGGHVPVPGAGFNLCQIIDGALVVNPVMV